MKSTGMLAITLGILGAAAALGQIQPPAGPRSGPGVQASQDAREPDVLKACKTPPPARGGPGRSGTRPGCGSRGGRVPRNTR